MSDVRTDKSRTLQDVFTPLLRQLGELTQQLRGGRSGNSELERLRLLLETLPLTTEQFGLATNRIQNAHRYVKARENGAARWELSALQQQLKKQLDLQNASYEPRRRGVTR